MRFYRLVLCALCFTVTACAGGQSETQPAVVDDFPNARLISDTLLVGGQPSEFDIDTFAHSGYDTVINLRTPGELPYDEKSYVEERGLTYVSIPVAGGAGITFENAALLDAALEDAGNAVVHCGSSNRVGGLFALRAYAAGGVTIDEAMSIGEAHGLAGLADTVRERLEEAAE